MTPLEGLALWKRRFGRPAAGLERTLGRLRRVRIRTPEALARLHEDLLFFRAYPPSAAAARLCDELLAGTSARVAALQGECSALEEPEISGIAGTALSAVFTYETACALAARHPTSIEIDWDGCDPDRIAPVLAALFPPACEEWPVEAHFEARQWLEAIKGENETALGRLLKLLSAAPLDARRRAELYDRMSLMLRWRLADSPAARTHTRLPYAELFLHDRPLLERRDVSLERALDAPPLPLERLALRDALPILDLILDSSAVRYRELYGFNHPDPRHVYRARPGRGLEIIFFGVPPAWRLPLRAYHAGMFFKNGVPAGYVELLSFFERAEVGFNLYYTFRDGETAWIYTQILRLARQLLGVTRYWLDPYQIGHDNEEAIQSGAFWFYRKLGFRSVDPALARLAEHEQRRLASEPGYRTPPRTLRRLAARSMIYEPPGAPPGEWDRFHIRTLALARWPAGIRRAFDELRPAKSAPEEALYLRRMQRQQELRAALIRLGSQ